VTTTTMRKARRRKRTTRKRPRGPTRSPALPTSGRWQAMRTRKVTTRIGSSRSRSDRSCDSTRTGSTPTTFPSRRRTLLRRLIEGRTYEVVDKALEDLLGG
jgi:hypothetical protein